MSLHGYNWLVLLDKRKSKRSIGTQIFLCFPLSPSLSATPWQKQWRTAFPLSLRTLPSTGKCAGTLRSILARSNQTSWLRRFTLWQQTHHFNEGWAWRVNGACAQYSGGTNMSRESWKSLKQEPPL